MKHARTIPLIFTALLVAIPIAEAALVIVQVADTRQAATTPPPLVRGQWINTNATGGYYLQAVGTQSSNATVMRLNWTGTQFATPAWTHPDTGFQAAFSKPASTEFFGLVSAGTSVSWYDAESMGTRGTIRFWDPNIILGSQNTTRPCTTSAAATIACDLLSVMNNETGTLILGKNGNSGGTTGIWAYSFNRWDTDFANNNRPLANMTQSFNSTSFDPSANCFTTSPGGSYFAHMPRLSPTAVTVHEAGNLATTHTINKAANVSVIDSCQWVDDQRIALQESNGNTRFVEFYWVSNSTFQKAILLESASGVLFGRDNGDYSHGGRVIFTKFSSTNTNPIVYVVNETLGGVQKLAASPSQANVTSATFVGDGNRYFGWGGDLVDTGSVTTVPGTPGTPTFTLQRVANNTGACVVIVWNNSANNAATGYSIFRSQDTGSHPVAVPMNMSAYSYATHVNTNGTYMCGLAHGADYHFRIVGTNATGEGPASADANVTTVAGEPSFVAAVAGANGTVAVNWTITDAVQKTTGYSIFSNTSAATIAYPLNNTMTYRVHQNSPTHSVNVTGLTPGITYCFRVEGTNASANGEGDISSVQGCAHLADLPTTPTLSVSEFDNDCGGATLAWSAALGTVSGYNLTRGGAGGPIVYHFDAGDLNYHVNLLTNNSTFSVHAFNGNGNGGESNTVSLASCDTALFGDVNGLIGNPDDGSLAAFGIDAPNVYAFLMGLIFVIFVGTGLTATVHPIAGGVGSLGAVLFVTAVGWWPFWAAIFIAVALIAIFVAVGARGARAGGGQEA